MSIPSTGSVDLFPSRSLSAKTVNPSAVAGFRWVSVALLASLAGMMPSRFVASTVSGIPTKGIMGLAVAGIVSGLVLFVFTGGRRISPSSIVFFAGAVFFAFPTLFLEWTGALTVEGRQAALAAAFAFGALFAGLVGRSPERVPIREAHEGLVGNRNAIVWTSIGVAALSTWIYVALPSLSGVGRWGLVASAFSIFTVGVLDIRRGARVMGWILTVASVGLAGIWFLVTFTGFGRINLAAVGLGFLTIWLLWFPSLRVKVVTALATPAGLTWAGISRSDAGAAGVWYEGAGLNSVMAPIRTFAELIREKDRLSFGPSEWIEQVIASIFFWVPRTVWPGKPEGFGRLLVYELRPGLSHTGHSMAASWLGEGYAYLGSVGIVIAILLLIGLVLTVERLFWFGASGRRARDLAALILGVWAGVQLLSYLWVGMFTFAARIGMMLGALGVLLTIVGALNSLGMRRGRARQGWRPPDDPPVPRPRERAVSGTRG